MHDLTWFQNESRITKEKMQRNELERKDYMFQHNMYAIEYVILRTQDTNKQPLNPLSVGMTQNHWIGYSKDENKKNIENLLLPVFLTAPSAKPKAPLFVVSKSLW